MSNSMYLKSVAVVVMLGGISVATETPAKQVLTSFVSCQISNTALDKTGISEKMLMDANSGEMIAAKVLSLLHDPNAAKLLANPRILTLDGKSASMELSNLCQVGLNASIQKTSLIKAKIDWQKTDSNSPGVESVNTRMQLHSGKPAVVRFLRLSDHTLFLIVTSEILDPNKPQAGSAGTASWGVGGMNAQPKDGKSPKDREGPWRYRAD